MRAASRPSASPSRWPLRYQILLPFTLVLLVAIVTVSALNAVVATQRSRQQIEEQLKGIVSTLAESSFPLTDVVLRQMHGLSGADFVFTDDEGHAVSSTDGIKIRPPERDDVIHQWQQLRLESPVTVGSERFFSMVLAMPRRGSKPPGTLQILYPERSWQAARREAIVPPLVVGGISLAATALLAVWLASRLTRPIVELRSQVNRIALADYTPMPLPPRNDELRDLAISVNRLAEQLTEMDRAIRRSERLTLVGQLAGGLAHHLRNNVTGALMAVQLHARECDADPESLTVALRQLGLLEENLKQFLAAPQSQSDTGLKCEVQLPDVLDEVVELVSPSLRHRRIALSMIDHSNGHAILQADAGQLRQLLVNLVLNGADAAGPSGRVKIAIELQNGEALTNAADAPQTTQSHVVLRVSDSGPGPAPDIAGRLFEPFFTNKPEGIGLGLAVSQQIAHSHGGSIFFSRAGGETNVEVHLPLAAKASKKLCPTS